MWTPRKLILMLQMKISLSPLKWFNLGLLQNILGTLKMTYTDLVLVYPGSKA